jgi:hypothetical protein
VEIAMGHAADFRTRAEQEQTERLGNLPKLLDAYGRPVVPGGHYSYSSGFPIAFQCVDIKRVLHPNAPPGLCEVTFATTISIGQVFERAPIRALQLISLPREAQAADGQKVATDAAGNGDGSVEGQAGVPNAPGPDIPDAPAGKIGGILLTDR